MLTDLLLTHGHWLAAMLMGGACRQNLEDNSVRDMHLNTFRCKKKYSFQWILLRAPEVQSVNLGVI